MTKSKHILAVGVAAVAVLALGATAYAQTTSTADTELLQEIRAGSLFTEIVDASGNAVTSPSIAMSVTDVDVNQQTTTGTYGSAGQRVYISNPGVTASGWTLDLAATDGAAGLWEDGVKNFDYNSTSGAGQLTINPFAGTITPVGPAPQTGITLSSSAAFEQGVRDVINVATASASAAPVWEGHITGMGVSQTIPGGQEAGMYRINLTQTLTAN